MGLLRSETMKYGLLVLPVSEAHRIVSRLGNGSNIQFEDDNARDMRRPYRKHIQRIDEMERILRFLQAEITQIEGCEIVKNKVEEFLKFDDAYSLEQVESQLQDLYKSFLKFKENNANLTNERNQAVEEAEVVAVAKGMLAGSSSAAVDEESFEASGKKPLLEGEIGGGRLGYLAGVVPKADEARFARALWRASRGNTFAQFTPITNVVKDPKTGQELQKSVFVAYFQGAGGPMQQKVFKVCQAFGVNMYNWPANAEMASIKHSQLQKLVMEKDAAMAAYADFMRAEAADLLAPPGHNSKGNSKMEEWRLFCIKEKAIYNILNLCSGEIALRVNVWYPASEESKIIAELQKLNEGSQQGAFLTPEKKIRSTAPTYVRTNDYTEMWQEVIDTYGIPKYQEANPALLSVVTFPFIFGMMYGDVGHGTLLFLAGLWLCKNAESFRFTQPVLFAVRYMVVSLGFFAIFAGFMYNDFFSIGLQIFESRWKDSGDGVNFIPDYDVKNSGGRGPYPFGLDWMWHGSSNELLYVNSMKMKLSVLFGVLQMTVGLLLRWSNAFFEKSVTNFFCECIPMMIFMLCFFGWMDVMILYKWVHPIDNPPSIINSLICMAMGQEDKFPFWDGSVQLAQKLMMYTVISVPIMLLPKPFVLLYQHKQKQAEGPHLAVDEESAGHGHGHGEEFEFGEIFIHQIIETIEFVLGTVSHTASYLRIWALSLAHQQLSLVFFQKTITMGLEMSFPMNGIVIYLMFGAWFGITLAVLLGMDVLECFLHTLRLHWVEFMSKFYKAEGLKFAPFSIKKLVTPTGDE
mmetsp:Transcript_95605/g.227736  ORF Transcript_95605/g.227736 Transcript_95605/m.227736 type:complete len:802 (+) Transcript_95605:65-2470(+)